MKIFIGSDHNGFKYKKQIIDYLRSLKYEVVDVGDKVLDPEDDFPKFASEVVDLLLSSNDKTDKAILVCGSGQGMCMAANRFKGIRASLCWNVTEAFDSRNDDDSNVLCLSAHQLNFEEIKAITSSYLNTPFAAAPRYIRRIKQLDQLGG
ncbi:MAG TPA: RpiB/LacA/LacB family sugar-phosphate isomerase [Candidatus Saccharimonadales bacterium]